MRVLITGVTGFVGSHLADYILEWHPEADLFGLKRWRSPRDNIRQTEEQLKLWHAEERLKLFDGDLQDLSSMITVIRAIKPDWIFHIAAQSFVPFSYLAPNLTIQINVVGTLNLLEAVRITNIAPRIHICSSSEVYGEPEENPITEECPLRGISPYGVSKLAEDMLADMYYQAYGLKTIRSRAFSHTGPRRGDVFVVSSFAKQIARIEKGIQEPVLKVGNLDSVRTFCDVRDTVRAYWLLLEKGEPGDVYNIAGNEAMTIRDMLNLLFSISNLHWPVEVKVDENLLRPKDVTIQIVDDSKFRQLTGWEPKIPLTKTLGDLLDYWRERI